MCLIFSGIPPHVDTHSAFEDTILSLSLGAQVGISPSACGRNISQQVQRDTHPQTCVLVVFPNVSTGDTKGAFINNENGSWSGENSLVL